MPKNTDLEMSKSKTGLVSFGHRVIRKIFVGTVKIGRHKIPKAVITGLVGVIFLYIAVAGMVSATTPWLVRGDTRQHIDYVWRISHGQIPRWNDGLRYPPFVKIFGYKHEAASANPPLFYIIHAPIIGPLLNQGKWQQAIELGRILNLAIGVLCILALAWAGWLYGGKRAALFSVAVPALSVMVYRFLRLNVDFALDVLLVFFATLAMVNVYKLIKVGPKLKYLIWAAVLSVLGMATKATYIVPFGINMLAIILSAYIWSDNKTLKKNLGKAVGISAAILALVAISIGWFYYFWNYKSTGKWFSASPKGYHGGRVPTTLFKAITSRRLWNLFYADYTNTVGSIAITSFVLASYFRISKKSFTDFIKDKKAVVLIGLLLLTVIGVWCTQVVLAASAGSVNFRYMLPALFPFGLYLSYGLLDYTNLKGQMVTAASVAMGLVTLTGLGLLHRTTIYAAVVANHVSIVVPRLLVIIFAIGAIMLSLSMYSLTSNKSS